jgi:hypothetical protein
VYVESLPGTHEDQGGVRIFVRFLEELLVILFGGFVIAIIETSLKIPPSGKFTLFQAVRGSQ